MKAKKEYIKFDHTVHYSIQGRKRYKRKLFLVFALLVFVLLCCSAMFYFGNSEWDPDEGFSPTAHPDNWWQILLIAAGAVITVASLVLTFLYCFFDIKKFYLTQADYFKSPKFKQNKAAALKKDLTKLDKKTLNWYKKLGYIDSQQMREIREKQKTAEKNIPEKEKAPK